MVKKSALVLLGLFSVASFQKTQALDLGWTEKTIMALALPMWYLHSKDPVMDPPNDAITNPQHPQFWSKENLKKFVDQKIIGQRYKPKSEKVSADRKIKFQIKDCWPTGVLGNIDAYVVQIGKRAASPLYKLYQVAIAAKFVDVLQKLK